MRERKEERSGQWFRFFVSVDEALICILQFLVEYRSIDVIRAGQIIIVRVKYFFIVMTVKKAR